MTRTPPTLATNLPTRQSDVRGPTESTLLVNIALNIIRSPVGRSGTTTDTLRVIDRPQVTLLGGRAASLPNTIPRETPATNVVGKPQMVA